MYPLLDEPIYPYEESFGSMFQASLYNQYYLLLGDFSNMNMIMNTDGREGEGWLYLENMLVVLYFLGSTFFTQIVILNMLIAIMGSTFARHEEDRH